MAPLAEGNQEETEHTKVTSRKIELMVPGGHLPSRPHRSNSPELWGYCSPGILEIPGRTWMLVLAMAMTREPCLSRRDTRKLPGSL